MMTKAQETLKKEIESLHSEQTVEKVESFILGLLAQQKIEKKKRPPVRRLS